MKNNKGFSLVSILLLFIGMALVGYYVVQNNKTTDNTQPGAAAVPGTTISSKGVWLLCGAGLPTATLKNDVWLFDGTTYSNILPNNPTPPSTQYSIRYDCEPFYFQNKFWMIGGQLSTNQPPGVWNSTDGVTWNLVSSNLQVSDRSGFGVAVYNGEIWVVGGYLTSSSILTNTVYHSPNGINWTQASNAPWSVRRDFRVKVYGKKLWLFGGRDGVNSFNDVWAFDGLTWTQFPNAPWSTRSLYGLEVYGTGALSKIWLLGGQANVGPLLNDVWTFDGITWIQMPNAPWSGRWAHTTFVFNNKLWVTSGFIQNSPWMVNDVWSYDGISWQPEPSTTIGPRYYMEAVSL